MFYRVLIRNDNENGFRRIRVGTLSMQMMQVWASLTSEQFRRGLGNTTKLNYGCLNDPDTSGVLHKNKKVIVVNHERLKQYGVKYYNAPYYSDIAKNQIRERAKEFNSISSHVSANNHWQK